MDIATIVLLIQGTLSLLSIFSLTLKPVRQWLFGVKERQEKEAKEAATEHESVKCLLRSEITRIYYANRERRRLHSFEYQNVSMLYEAYKAMGGNSFVDRIWAEMQEWEIIP